MLLEDQYGVGDIVDLGEASGTVEAVGLRTPSIRDGRGVLWHIRNGEVVRVGNKSQGWALVVIDLPIGFARVDEATAVLHRGGARSWPRTHEWSEKMMGRPRCSASSSSPWTARPPYDREDHRRRSVAVARELRRRLTEALAEAGIARAMSAGRVYLRPPTEGGPGDADLNGTDTAGNVGRDHRRLTVGSRAARLIQISSFRSVVSRVPADLTASTRRPGR